MKIILASGSPRRKELLEQVGVTFDIYTCDTDENIDEKKPDLAVLELSKRKAMAVAIELQNEGEKDCLIIGADTVVAYDDQILGKPIDEENALEILMKLSGNEHSVFTGVTMIRISNGKINIFSSFAEETKVLMYQFNKKEAKAYIATKEPMDKAGAYGIQGIGAILVERIEGDYNNVVGLPVAKVYRYLKEI